MEDARHSLQAPHSPGLVPAGLRPQPLFARSRRVARPRRPAQPVPVVLQRGRCARRPGALGGPRVSTELLLVAVGTSRTRCFSFCLATLGPALRQKRACSPWPCAVALPHRAKASWDLLLAPAGLAESDARPGGRMLMARGAPPALGASPVALLPPYKGFCLPQGAPCLVGWRPARVLALVWGSGAWVRCSPGTGRADLGPEGSGLGSDGAAVPSRPREMLPLLQRAHGPPLRLPERPRLHRLVQGSPPHTLHRHPGRGCRGLSVWGPVFLGV